MHKCYNLSLQIASFLLWTYEMFERAGAGRHGVKKIYGKRKKALCLC